MANGDELSKELFKALDDPTKDIAKSLNTFMSKYQKEHNIPPPPKICKISICGIDGKVHTVKIKKCKKRK